MIFVDGPVRFNGVLLAKLVYGSLGPLGFRDLSMAQLVGTIPPSHRSLAMKLQVEPPFL